MTAEHLPSRGRAGAIPSAANRAARPVLAAVSVSLAILSGGCAVVAVTDAAVTVAATVVKVGANVVGGAVDVARAGVRAVTNSNDSNK
jgi:hypothetical protein